MQQNIAYNVENKIEDGITDIDLFKSTYNLENFYEGQYQQFLTATFPQQANSEQKPQDYQPDQEVNETDENLPDTSNDAGIEVHEKTVDNDGSLPMP